jgi:hypothetical protein
MEPLLLSICLLFQLASTQTDWTGGRGAAGPASDFGTAFYASDSVTYNVSGQISPVACSANVKSWIKHTVERNPCIDGHGGLYPADFDGDGDLDLSGWMSLGCTLRFYRNFEAESDSVGYQAIASYAAPTGSKGKYGQTWAGDINNDGRPDVAVVCSTRVFWYENLGNFNFALHDLGAAIHPQGGVEGADINRDGLVDLIVGDIPLEVWYQEPGGTFRPQYVWSGERYKILVGYINNDQWPDLLAEDQVFLNDNGTFPSTPTWNAKLTGPDGIWIRDFNNDVLPDILVCDQWASTPGIYWYENLGNGTDFRQHTIYKDANAQRYGDGACAEDVDADGKADVVGSYSRVGFFRQVTPDSFTLVELDTITDSHWIRTANLDYKPNGNDRDIDILVSGRGQFAWYENDMQSKFSCNGWLVSTILDAGLGVSWQTLVWDAARPGGTLLDFFVRTGATPEQCTTSIWGGPISVRTGVQLDSAGIQQYTRQGDRYFQYRVAMASDNARSPGLTPAVYSIKVVYNPSNRRHDVRTAQILAPDGVADTILKVTPSARVENLGSATETFYTLFTIDHTNGTPLYRDSALATLAPGASYLQLFLPLRFSVCGPYVVRCSTMLADDENRANDALAHVCKALGRPPWPEGWHEAASMPLLPSGKASKKGGWLTFVSGPGVYFSAKGNKTADFYRYDPVQDTWGLRRGIPAGLEARLPAGGATGVSDGNRYVYATKGNNTFGFWRYDMMKDSWAQLPNVLPAGSGKKVKGGTDLAFVHKHDTDYVYLLKGGKSDFCRYNATAGYWTTVPAPPLGASVKWDNGSWLAYDGDRYVYAHKAKYCELWKYDTQADTWFSTMLPGMPTYNPITHQNKKAKNGGSAAWYDSAVYALKGAGTLEYWKYDVATNLWSNQETIPGVGSSGRRTKVKDGGDIAAFGAGVFFAMKGSKSCQFWRYTLSSEIVAPAPGREGVMAGRLARGDCRVSIAPNPVSGRAVRLSYTLPTAGRATVTLFDVSGRVVRQHVAAVARSGSLDLTLFGLTSGTYVLRLVGDKYSTTERLVITR